MEQLEVINCGLGDLAEKQDHVTKAYRRNENTRAALEEHYFQRERLFQELKEANLIVRKAMKNGKTYKITDNGFGNKGQKSFSVIIDSKIVIGTKGETHIKIVYDELNNVWTTYPVPKP